MVHLGRVATDLEVQDKLVGDIGGIDLGVADEDEFTTSVYGSRFAATDLPKHEIPDDEMPREIAYRMIK